MPQGWLRALLLGLWLLLPERSAASPDGDADGVPDGQDNCLVLANPSQLDSDRDGFGNGCDFDYDGDGTCGSGDYRSLQAALLSSTGDPLYDPALDADGDGGIGAHELSLFKSAYLTPIGPSGLACAGATPCACDRPVLESADEVLSQDVALAWTAASGLGFEIERRRLGGTWQKVASVSPGSSSYLDRSAAPGTYWYRIRAACSPGADTPQWSEYSNSVGFALPTECEGQADLGPGLPVVRITDRDSDQAYTGRDIELALIECSLLAGCILQALPVVYDDVAIVLSDGDDGVCSPSTTSCLGPGYAFPNGLVIQGHGSRTVFRSPVWAQPYTPSRILQVWKRPDIRLRLRNLVLDGRKQEQQNPQVPQYSWFHYGVEVWHHGDDSLPPNRDGCIHNVTARRLMARGLSLANTNGWIVENSLVEDVGCMDGVTPCPLITTPSYAGTLGYQSAGYGIDSGSDNDDLVIRDNTIRRVAKYSIGLKSGSLGGEVGAIERPTILNNRIEQAGEVGIFVAGVSDALVAGNVIESTHSPIVLAAAAYDTWGIVAADGFVARSSFRGNRILGSSGIGIGWHASGPDNVISGNLIEGSCRERKPSTGYRFADLYVGNYASGTLRLEDNEVRDSDCAWALGIYGKELAVRTTIRGGSYQSGPESLSPVPFQGVDVKLECGVSVERTRLRACVGYSQQTVSQNPLVQVPASGVVTSSVTGEHCLPVASVDPASNAFVSIGAADPSDCPP